METPGRPSSGVGVPVADVTAAFATVFAAVSAALTAIFVSSHHAREWLAAPTGLVALCTTAAFAAAAVLGTWAARRTLTRSRFRLIIPAIAAWALLDRIGYGLGLVPGDITARSLGDLGRSWAGWALPLGVGPSLGAASLVALGMVAVAARRAGRRWADGHVLVTEPRVIDFLVAAATLILAGALLPLFGSGSMLAFATEMAGLAGSFVLVLAALAAGDHRRTVAGWRGRMRPWMAEAPRPPADPR